MSVVVSEGFEGWIEIDGDKSSTTGAEGKDWNCNVLTKG